MTTVLWNDSRVLRDAGLFFCSMLPFVENKAAILLAAALNVKWYVAYFFSSLGCLVPARFLLRHGTAALEKLRRWRPADAMLGGVDRFVQQHPRFFEKNAYLSLLLVISIPFTGVGIWAGCAICSILKLDKRRSWWTMAAAIALSGLVTTLTTYGILVGVRSLWQLVF